MKVCIYACIIYTSMHLCKCATMQVFRYASMQVNMYAYKKVYKYAKSIEIFKYRTFRLAIFSTMIVVWIYSGMQKCHVYNYVSMKVCKYEVMQVWNY